MCRGAWRACSRASAAAAGVAKSVVDAWQRRAPGTEATLRECAALGRAMADALDALGACAGRPGGGVGDDDSKDADSKDPDRRSGESLLDPFAGGGSEEARGALATFAGALEKHKALQAKIWPAVSSPGVEGLYAALAPLALGSHICGAGNGGHVVAILKPDVTRDDVEEAVEKCAEAPEARVVRVQMMFGGEGEEEGEGGEENGVGGGKGSGGSGGRRMRRGRRMTPKRRTPPRNARGIPPRGRTRRGRWGAGRGGEGAEEGERPGRGGGEGGEGRGV